MSLTLEDYAKLSVPVPADQILTADMGNGPKDYANVDYLESRLREVDLDYEERYVREEDTLTCFLTLKGVTRSANAGIDPPSGKIGNRHMQMGKHEAQAFRRVCAKFLLGAELWPDKTIDQPKRTPRRDSQSYDRNGSSSSSGSLSPKQRYALVNAYQIPEKAVDLLDSQSVQKVFDYLKPLLSDTREYKKNLRRNIIKAFKGIGDPYAWEGDEEEEDID